MMPGTSTASQVIQETSNLFTQLRTAAEQSGLDMQQLGGKLGIDEEETQVLLGGGVDITLSDLEVLLVALDCNLDIDINRRSENEA